MDEKILTVTVPSYNVQAYLEDCLESVVNSEVMEDIEVLREAGKDRLDVTVGSALDIFGGSIPFDMLVKLH